MIAQLTIISQWYVYDINMVIENNQVYYEMVMFYGKTAVAYEIEIIAQYSMILQFVMKAQCQVYDITIDHGSTVVCS